MSIRVEDLIWEEFRVLLLLFEVPDRFKPKVVFQRRMKESVDELFTISLDVIAIRSGLTLPKARICMKHGFAHFLQKYTRSGFSCKQADAFAYAERPEYIIPVPDWSVIKTVTIHQTDLRGYSIGISWDVIV